MPFARSGHRIKCSTARVGTDLHKKNCYRKVTEKRTKCSSGFPGNHVKHQDDALLTRLDFIDMALRWALKMDQYQNQGKDAREVVETIYGSWPFKWHQNPDVLASSIKSSLKRAKKNEEREEYDEVYGVNARPLLDKFVEFLQQPRKQERLMSEMVEKANALFVPHGFDVVSNTNRRLSVTNGEFL